MALKLDELGDAFVAQVEQGVEALTVKGRLLASAWSSIISPVSVATRFMSTSAWLSSE